LISAIWEADNSAFCGKSFKQKQSFKDRSLSIHDRFLQSSMTANLKSILLLLFLGSILFVASSYGALPAPDQDNGSITLPPGFPGARRG
jgi:hypothetical protein